MLLDQLAEFAKQAARVVRSRRGFRMILYAEHRLGFVAHALDRLVVEIDAVHRHVAWQRVDVHREAVLLSGDLHSATLEILHRLIGATMAKLQFARFAAHGQAKDLVAKADAENRQPFLQ